MEEKRKKLVENHVNFAYKKCHQWKRKTKTLDYDSILDLCFLGLCKAGNKFDFTREIQFMTFANVVIDNEIRMELRRENKRQNDYLLSELLFEDEDGDERISKKVEKEFSIEDNTSIINSYLSLKNGLDMLTKREKQIIYLYVFKNKTQREIGEILGIRQSYVSRLHKKACRKLAKYN